MLGHRMMMAAAGHTPDLPVTSDLKMHFRSDLGVTKSSDLVSSWADQSSNGRDITEATNKPLWVGGLVNGRPAIRFDGTNDLLSETGGTVALPFHIFLVLNQVSWSLNGRLIGAIDGPASSLIQNSSTPQVRQLNTTISSGFVSPTIGTFFLLHSLFNNAGAFLSLNDGAEQAGSNSTRPLTDGFVLGASIADGSFANIEFAEVIIYTAEKTGADLTSIRDYLNTLYSLW